MDQWLTDCSAYLENENTRCASTYKSSIAVVLESESETDLEAAVERINNSGLYIESMDTTYFIFSKAYHYYFVLSNSFSIFFGKSFYFEIYVFLVGVLRQCWRNQTIWLTSIRFFSCKKQSKITKNASILLKQHRIDRFSPSKTTKNFLGRKKLKCQSTSQQKVQTNTPTKLFPQKILKFDLLGGFSNFQNWIFFVIFGFPSKKVFFLNYKLTFVSPQKFLD